MTWISGLPPSFVILYYPSNSENEKHEEEVKNRFTYTVTGLSAATTYIFSVKAKNRLGESTPVSTNATTTVAGSYGMKFIFTFFHY